MLLESVYKLNPKDPKKSEILIQGFGRMDLDQAKQSTIKRLKRAISFIEKEDSINAWENTNHSLYSTGVINALLTAIIDAEKEIQEEIDNGST